jgi:hypothetical protein
LCPPLNSKIDTALLLVQAGSTDPLTYFTVHHGNRLV